MVTSYYDLDDRSARPVNAIDNCNSRPCIPCNNDNRNEDEQQGESVNLVWAISDTGLIRHEAGRDKAYLMG